MTWISLNFRLARSFLRFLKTESYLDHGVRLISPLYGETDGYKLSKLYENHSEILVKVF